jgi:hypothetical protein
VADPIHIGRRVEDRHLVLERSGYDLLLTGSMGEIILTVDELRWLTDVGGPAALVAMERARRLEEGA